MSIGEQMRHLAEALINLNHPAHYFGIGNFQVSAGNAVIIITMFVIFALALVLPFPGEGDDK
jgi:hypothetical protein